MSYLTDLIKICMVQLEIHYEFLSQLLIAIFTRIMQVEPASSAVLSSSEPKKIIQ